MNKLATGLVIVVIGAIGAAVFANGHTKTPVVSTIQNKIVYVALGDSVAAGEGLNTNSDSSACNRTNESYPNVITKTLMLDLANYSCTGATIAQGIIGTQRVNNYSTDAQVLQLANRSNVSLITMTIGANDVGWTSMIAKCYSAECGSADDSAQLATKMQVMSGALKDALVSIKNQNPAAKTLVTGYYQLVPASVSSCDTLIGISDQELQWLRTQDDNLNTAIKNAVTSAGYGKFVKLDFTGHELCTKAPWIQDLQQKTPFHPNKDGQNSIAQAIVDSYSADL